MLAGLVDHLWQSTCVFGAIALLAFMVRNEFAPLRLWLWRIAALKFAVPFALLFAIGAWFGFPVPYPRTDDSAPDALVQAFAVLTSLASPARIHGWTVLPQLLALAFALPIAVTCVHWLRGRIRIEKERVQDEALRRERDADDIVARPGFLKSAFLTICVLSVAGIPILGGAVEDRQQRLQRLRSNTLALRHANLEMALAAPGMGTRYRVNVDTRGVSIRNVSVQDLVAIAYGIGHYAVTSDQRFYEDDPAPISWLSWPRYDIRIAAPVPAPEDFSPYALREGVTSLLAQRYGFQIYANGKCQPPCGRYGMPPAQDEIFAAASSPVRAQFKRFMTAFNVGDRAALQQFAAREISPRFEDSPNFDEALYMHKQTGGFDVLELDETAPNILTGWLRAREAEAIMALTFEVEPEAPHRVVRFRGEWGAPPEKFRRPRLSELQTVRALHAEGVYRDMTARFSGAVLLARGGKVLLRDVFGFADRDLQIPNTIDTRFRTASVTKMFTAVAVLRLVQDGRIKLQDPVGRLLPGLARKPIARATIHQLLTHTSGAGDVFGPRYAEHQRELRTHADYVKMFGADPLRYEPGKGHEYSNLGFILLGAIIERVSGKSYYDYVQDVVFDPAGMTRTGSLPEEVEVEGRAIGYDRPPGTREWISAMPFIDYRGLAACGAYSTVEDMARFLEALRSNRLLSENYTRLMLEPQQKEWDGRHYGYGITIESYPKTGLWIGHNGNDHGMNAEAWFSPESGYTLIVLSNFDPPGATQLAQFTMARLPLLAPP